MRLLLIIALCTVLKYVMGWNYHFFASFAGGNTSKSVATKIAMSAALPTCYPLQNDLMIRAAKGEKVERTPVWVYRQAGRHLPEYNAYKKSRNKNFLELLQDPKDVTECTMQPVRRYNLDAAILFSDILVILQALDIEVTMPGGVGIMVPNPLKSPEEISTRLPTSINVKERLSHVFKAVEMIKAELKGKIPLIGFSAAPWSLFFYLVGGSTKKNQQIGEEWLQKYPTECQKLFDFLTVIVIDYLSAQIEAGADLIQVFEAIGEYISPSNFQQFCLPSLQRIASELKKRHPSIPLLVFPRGAGYSIYDLQAAGYDVVCIDNQIESREGIRNGLKSAAREQIPPRGIAAGIQGNFKVEWLQREFSSEEKVREETRKLLTEFGPQGLIANLGEGLGGKEDVALVATFVDSVHEISEELIRKSQDE